MTDFKFVIKDAYGKLNRDFVPDPAGGSGTVFRVL